MNDKNNYKKNTTYNADKSEYSYYEKFFKELMKEYNKDKFRIDTNKIEEKAKQFLREYSLNNTKEQMRLKSLKLNPIQLNHQKIQEHYKLYEKQEKYQKQLQLQQEQKRKQYQQVQ